MSIDLTERRIAELARMVENEECPSDGMTLLAVDIALSDAPALITLLRVIRNRAGLEPGVMLCPTNPLDVHPASLGAEHCVSCLQAERDLLRFALTNISPGTLAVVDRNLEKQRTT